MERVINATEARVHFGHLLRRVAEDGETVIVERGGIRRAVVLGLAQYERLLSGSTGAGWHDRVSDARQQVRDELQGRSIPSPADILQTAREERDERFDRLR